MYLHGRPFHSARDIYWQESILIAIKLAEANLVHPEKPAYKKMAEGLILMAGKQVQPGLC
jgi:hypothetical protein